MPKKVGNNSMTAMFTAGIEPSNPVTAALNPTLSINRNAAFEEYDPGSVQIINKAIRNMAGITQYCKKKAYEVLEQLDSDHFSVLVSNGPDQQRPRAYILPTTGTGIHQELSQAVLLKAAMSMEGK